MLGPDCADKFEITQEMIDDFNSTIEIPVELNSIPNYETTLNIKFTGNREELFEMGKKGPYKRYLQFPVELKTEIKLENTDNYERLKDILLNDKAGGAVDIVWGPAMDYIPVQKLETPEVEYPLDFLWNPQPTSLDLFNAYFQSPQGLNGIASSGNIQVMTNPMMVGGSGSLNIKWINSQPSLTTGLSWPHNPTGPKDDEMSQGSQVQKCICKMEQLLKAGCQCGGI